ncbi:hypothetical protein BDY21DRAFT_416432 [Lineolata rhizophorae]|uniref:SH3 domain-containing protein n=1 Tax=Lineolata rhizophorae TaxID=578093 RepID=A0A6A6NV86_9PEZI|nr:hypothetical protein BDY21DRAFT_416432 [Lineolata rhizophorae]
MASPPFKVKAIYEYNSPHDDDLSFPEGQVITVTEEEDADWYVGEYADASGARHDGLFPKNFVEKFEPAPPPRPVRPTHRQKHSEAAAAPAPPPAPVDEPQSAHGEPQSAKPVEEEHPAPDERPAAAPAPAAPKSPEPRQRELPPAAAATKPGPPPAANKVPPPVAEKPSSFKDRIAAFNKPAAAPIAPFKPGGPGGSSNTSTGFIKKPFVAPPPSRNAYVPPPRAEAPPQKVYRREEDPEIAERQARDLEIAEKAGLAAHDAEAAAATGAAEEGGDAPKPTSLKERIALLQKQQMEQAQRQAASHKEKPKRPPKKRTESHEREGMQPQPPTPAPARESGEMERVQSGEATERESMDSMPAPPPRRQSHQPPKVPDLVPRAGEAFSDGNDADQSAAGETTEDAEGTSTSVDEEEARHKHAPTREPEVGDEEDTTEGDGEEEEEEMDPETRRRMELRERMAKMSGGMGMAGMFGPPGGMPMPGAGASKKKKPAAGEQHRMSEEAESPASPQAQPPRIPMIPVPGMAPMKSPESEETEMAVERDETTPHPVTGGRDPLEVPDVEEAAPRPDERGAPPPLPRDRPAPPPPSAGEPGSPPPVPASRPVPPPDSRPVPPPPQAQPMSPSSGSETDDEMPVSTTATGPSVPSTGEELPHRGPPPPIPTATSPQATRTPMSPAQKRTSYFGTTDSASPTSPAMPAAPGDSKRASRPPPPIPGTSPGPPPPGHARPPPPPPPGAPPSRQPTSESIHGRIAAAKDGEEETEYEGDYDTDIAPGATHKDALKSHARDSSLDDSTTADDAPGKSPPLPQSPTVPPPVPGSAAPRAVPPPPPPGAPPKRQSSEAPRAAPPPPPPPMAGPDEDEYDPYRYAHPATRMPPPPPQAAPHAPPPPMPAAHPQPAEESDGDEDELYANPPPPPPPPVRKSVERPPPPPPQAPPPSHHDRPMPPLPPQGPPPSSSSTAGAAPRGSGRQSLDVNQTLAQGGVSRRSAEQPRPSMGDVQDFIAHDVDLGVATQWWTAPNGAPPVFAGRKDVLVEVEEVRTPTGGIEREVYVLYHDYSQTVVTARFDPRDPGDCEVSQRHEGPPARLRQDQLEDAWARFGRRIAEEAASRQGQVVGDGSPAALVEELLGAGPGGAMSAVRGRALRPVGTRAYGALVYANLANASVQQLDEIRAGDVVTLRNARFQGKHGPMHQKYSVEVGKPDHVGVVVDWDGTKKKVRAWEQGRESRKVKVEGFRVGDLRSGEVRVWRVMGRGWVGWGES